MQLLELENSILKRKVSFVLKTLWFERQSFKQYFIFLSIIRSEDSQLIYDLYKELLGKKKPAWCVKSSELMSLGLRGKNLGTIIKLLKQKWIESDFTLSESDLIKSLNNYEK